MGRRIQKAAMKPYGINSLHIDKFRAMRDLDIPLAQRITIIAGQNGTGKSTLLGMVGQPFGLRNNKTIFDKPFSTKFTDIFNMSPEHDQPGDHVYFVDFNDLNIPGSQGQHVQVKSYTRPPADKSHIRIVTGKSRTKGEGNIDYPVIYLGLKRTYPVGEFQNPKSQSAGLTDEELETFVDWYSRVIAESTKSVEPVRMSRKGQKETLLVNTNEYDYLANSAGQDNLGQILGALISFGRIKQELGNSYHGGLLLIDEFDATLFPSSQQSLYDLVYDAAGDLMLQVVFTTHSISLISHALDCIDHGAESLVLYLRKLESGIQISKNPPLDDIEADLLVRPLPAPQNFRVEIWCEDEEAAWLLRKMMPAKLSAKCKVIAAGLGCGELSELAIRDKIPSLKYVLFVVDGDSNKNANNKIKSCNKRFVFPGGNLSPEDSIHEVLEALPDDDPFWSNSRRYTKQVFRKRYSDGKREYELSGGTKRRKYSKMWLKTEKSEKFWGENGSAVYKLWSAEHQSEIEEFCNRLERRVDGMIRRHDHEKGR